MPSPWGMRSVRLTRVAVARVTRGAVARLTRGAMVRVTRGAMARVTRGAMVRVTRGAMARVTRGRMARSTRVPVARVTRVAVIVLAGLVLTAGCGQGGEAGQGDEEARGGPGGSGDAATAAPGHDAAQHADSAAPPPLRDQAGRTVTLASHPLRIVSLVPSATGILLELGLEDRIVGRTDYDDDPQLEDIPSVGGGIHPSLERIVRLAPDLVIRFEGDQDRITPPALDRMGIAHLGVRPDRIRDVHEMVELLARATGRAEEGARIIERIEGELAAVRETVAGAPRPSVALLLGGDPPWVVVEGTFLHDLLVVAGAENALADAGTFASPATVSVETIIRREVDLLLAPEYASIPPSLSHLPLRRLPDHIGAPGVELGASARAISRVLHPELWP